VLRGGAFNNHNQNVRCAYRNNNEPDIRNNNIGFRCVAATFFERLRPEMPGGAYPPSGPRRKMAEPGPGRTYLGDGFDR
jgi:hypothetical protein